MANVKSAITFGLVHIPVKLNPVIKNNDTSFNYLHKKCENRVSYIKYCRHCKKEVKPNELVKGFEYEDDKYVIFTDEDFDKLKSDEDRVIEIISFVNLKDIDPIYYERSYYLKGDNKNKAFALFKAALKKAGKVAIAKTIIGSKSYYVILRFGEGNIIMTTLYYEEEIRLDESEEKVKYNENEMELALKLIESMTGAFEPSEYVDEYQNDIKKAIDKKIEGKVILKKKQKKNISITNLMDALEESLKVKGKNEGTI